MRLGNTRMLERIRPKAVRRQVSVSRRKQRDLVDSKGVFGLVIGIGILWPIGQPLLSPHFLEGIDFVLVLSVAAAIAYVIIRHYQRAAAQRAVIQKAQK